MQRRGLGDHAEPLVARRRSAPATRRPPSAPSRYSQRTSYSSPGAVVADRRPDAVVVLLEVDQLVVEADPARARAPRPAPSAAARGGSAGGSAGATGSRRASTRPRRRRPSSRAWQAAAVVGVGAGEAGVEGRRRHLLGRRAALARSRSATPTSSSTSIARWLSTCAFGRSDVSGRALTSRCSTPCRASSIDAVRPAPPPPTMRTGTSLRQLVVNTSSSLLGCNDWSARYNT